MFAGHHLRQYAVSFVTTLTARVTLQALMTLGYEFLACETQTTHFICLLLLVQ